MSKPDDIPQWAWDDAVKCRFAMLYGNAAVMSPEGIRHHYESICVIARSLDAAHSKGQAEQRDVDALNEFSRVCHEANIQWWRNTKTGEPIERNKGELLCLIHSEISEAMEGERKDLMDDKLPRRRMAEVELADTLIRIFDYAGAFGYDLSGAFRDKMAFNANRADHKTEARNRAGGKKW